MNRLSDHDEALIELVGPHYRDVLEVCYGTNTTVLEKCFRCKEQGVQPLEEYSLCEECIEAAIGVLDREDDGDFRCEGRLPVTGSTMETKRCDKEASYCVDCYEKERRDCEICTDDTQKDRTVCMDCHEEAIQKVSAMLGVEE